MKHDWSNKEFKKLVTLGESTTAGGWASTRERCWASQLAREIDECQRMPVQLINVGIGANVISTRSPAYPHSGKPAADERLDKHVIAHEPDLLIIAYGLNDSRGGTPVDQFTECMRDIIGRVRAKIQPLVVLLGPYFMTKFDLGGATWAQGSLDRLKDFNTATRGVADESHCLFVDLLSAYGEAPWLVHPDGVHAHDVSHRMVAHRIFDVLAANCSGLSQETLALTASIPPWRDESTLKSDYDY